MLRSWTRKETAFHREFRHSLKQVGWILSAGFQILNRGNFAFDCTHDAPFNTNEAITFHAVPVPAPKTWGQSVSATLEGFKITFQFYNRDAFNYSITPYPVGFHTYLKLERADSDGKTPPFRDGECPSWGGLGGNIPSDVAAIDITFTISSNRYVEFLARPLAASTNSLSTAK